MDAYSSINDEIIADIEADNTLDADLKLGQIELSQTCEEQSKHRGLLDR